MADAEIRAFQDADACVDDSPPVCLVQLVHSKAVIQTAESFESQCAMDNRLVQSPSENNLSPSALQATPEVPRTVHSPSCPKLPDDDVVDYASNIMPVELCADIGTAELLTQTPVKSVVDESGTSGCCRPLIMDSSENDESQSRPALICNGIPEIPPLDLVQSSAVNTLTCVKLATTSVPIKLQVSHTDPQPSITVHTKNDVDRQEDPGLTDTGGCDDDDDFDIDDRPLTVDLLQETEASMIAGGGNSNFSTGKPSLPVETTNAGELPTTSLPPACILPSATTREQQPVQHIAPIISLPSAGAVASVESTIFSCQDSRPPTMLLEFEGSSCPHLSSLTAVTETDTAKMLSVSSTTVNPICSADTSTSHLDPSFISSSPVSSVFTSVPLCLPNTTMLGIRPKPPIPQTIPSVHLVTATPTPVTTPLPSQSTVHLVPFVAASVGSPSLPNPPIPLGNLTGPTPGMSISGAVAPGTAGLQILNVTPMSPFVGTPGIVLHTAGTPNFQPATNPLLSGLPSAAALGGGAALNFLQPGPPTFATTLLQPPTGTPTDFMFEHTLGLAHSLGPAGSLTLLNPGNSASSVMESFATGPLPSIYPTLFHPSPHSSAPNPALLSTSTSVFIPPTYRQSAAGTTNLVNATAPQMSTSMTSGGLATGLFPGPSLSHANHVAGGAAAGTGLMFQPAPGPLLPPAFGLTSVSLLQSYPFPSYSFPFHGATDLTSLSVTAAPSMCSTSFPVYRPEDYNTRSSIPVCPVTLHPAPIMSCATASTANLNSLPQPPALQPCPAVSKRLHRLPLSSTRTGSPAVTTMSGRHVAAGTGFSAVQHTVISSTVPGVLPRATPTVTGNIGIRAPNSTIVLPALRRRRSRVLVKPKPVATVAVGIESTPSRLVPAVGVSQIGKVSPPVSSTCSSPVRFSSQAAVPNNVVSFKSDDSSQVKLLTEHTHPDLSPVVSEPICSTFDGQLLAPNKLPSTSSSPPLGVVLTTTETSEESKTTVCISETPSPTLGSNSDRVVTEMHNGVDQSVEHLAATLNSTDQHNMRSPSAQRCDTPVPNTFKSTVGESSSSTTSPMPSSTGSTCSSPQSSSSPPASQRNTSPIVTTSPTNCIRTPLVKLPNGIHDHGELNTSMQRLGVTCSSTVTGETDENQVSPVLIATGLLPVSRTDRRYTPSVPPPLLHHGPDDHRILTHVLDGHVIYESNRPFPVRNGMAVVEAALLQQCVREQAETTIGKSLAKTTRTQPMDLEPMANGHEPMQMDEEVLIKRSADSPGSGESNRSTRISRKPSRTHLSSSNSPSNLRCNHGLPSKRSLEPGSISECSMICKFGEEATVRSDKTMPPAVRLATVSPPFSRPLSTGSNVDSPASISSSTKDDSSRVCQPVPLPYRSPTVARTSPGAVSTCTVPPIRFVTFVEQVIPDVIHPLPVSFRSFPPFPPPYAVAPQQPAPPPPGPVRHWTPDDVVTFVQGTPGCGAYASAFLTNEIDGEALLLLAKDQFIQPPIGMKIGPALKLAARLESIRHVN
ncbi:uncharacterized protein DEA37_0003872 [Paragonimus westermani]|uniref:SAM domain-containing protein n=1 Tax=Paragonimus westermani TaxID=34504 RepID=A0A5J4NGH2_9TREM|nr:uncharacterized protein DEA37_0003872 [Paragonimus westermani]